MPNAWLAGSFSIGLTVVPGVFQDVDEWPTAVKM